jgi:hypothetical protein
MLQFIWTSLLPGLPAALVCIIGCILALVYSRRHPRVSALALTGFGLLLLFWVAGGLLSTVPVIMQNRGARMEWVAFNFGLLSNIMGVLRGIALALVLAAVFAGRG